jgi:hypothetical protein
MFASSTMALLFLFAPARGLIRRLHHDVTRWKPPGPFSSRTRRLRDRRVLLAVDVNRIAVRGVKPADITLTRVVLPAIIENLPGEEWVADRRMPSTRDPAQRVAGGHNARS